MEYTKMTLNVYEPQIVVFRKMKMTVREGKREWPRSCAEKKGKVKNSGMASKLPNMRYDWSLLWFYQFMSDWEEHIVKTIRSAEEVC